MSQSDTRPEPDLVTLEGEELLRELAGRDAAYAEGSAIYDLVNKTSEMLKQVRSHAGLTQSGLADKLGVSQGRISQLESGLPDHAPSLEMIARIALACGVTLRITTDFPFSLSTGWPIVPSIQAGIRSPAEGAALVEKKHGGNS